MKSNFHNSLKAHTNSTHKFTYFFTTACRWVRWVNSLLKYWWYACRSWRRYRWSSRQHDTARQCRLLEGPALFARRLHVANAFPLPVPAETVSGSVDRERVIVGRAGVGGSVSVGHCSATLRRPPTSNTQIIDQFAPRKVYIIQRRYMCAWLSYTVFPRKRRKCDYFCTDCSDVSCPYCTVINTNVLARLVRCAALLLRAWRLSVCLTACWLIAIKQLQHRWWDRSLSWLPACWSRLLILRKTHSWVWKVYSCYRFDWSVSRAFQNFKCERVVTRPKICIKV